MKAIRRVAKVLLLSNLIWLSIQEILYNREKRATNFNEKYAKFQIVVSPYFCLPWPAVYNLTDESILIWNYTKLIIALLSLRPKGGLIWLLKNMLLTECMINICGGCQCLCYFVDQLTLIAGLLILMSVRQYNCQ